jgi:hypothetical protein
MKDFLLPYHWKFTGIFLSLSGIVLAIFYIWFDFRFTMPVFAVYSSFLETKMFTTFNTNYADDLILILLLSGFTLIVFTKERIESEKIALSRAKAVTFAFISNFIFLMFSILFIFGSGFIGVLVLNLFSLPIFYLIIFFFQKRKQLNNIHSSK